MLFSLRYGAIAKFLAISFLLGIVVFVSVPQVSDREGNYRPAHENRLAALYDRVDGTSFNRAVKRCDRPGAPGFLALARFRHAQAQRAVALSFRIVEGSNQRPTTGVLPIRSPPFQLFL
jgi:hypothetical protein